MYIFIPFSSVRHVRLLAIHIQYKYIFLLGLNEVGINRIKESWAKYTITSFLIVYIKWLG